MELNRLLHHYKLVSISKSIERVELKFESSTEKIEMDFTGFAFETNSFSLGKRLLRYSDSQTLGIKSLEFLSKSRITPNHMYKQLTLEFEPDGFYKNELICLYKIHSISFRDFL